MYRLENIKKDGLEFLELKNSDSSSMALISLYQGGSLQELLFKNSQVIANMNPLKYEDTYASSILFPFANRIKDGLYTFNEKTFKLDCNEKERNNALHGLVYDKPFECIKKKVTLKYCSVTLRYEDFGATKGFPFKYEILLTYKLSDNGISLKVKVQNLDHIPFPFTLGWHPYFVSTDLYHSHLNFKSGKKLRFDHQQITSGIIEYSVKIPYQIKDNQLDDGYVLETNEIEFITPTHTLKMNSTAQENFLQMYTPAIDNTIAIEPMTGVSDSFNNKIGLQTLSPNENYKVSWTIRIEKSNIIT